MQAAPTTRGNAFRQVAAPLANELLASLEQEHVREVVKLYEEQVMIREELRRAVEVLQRDMLPRERLLHDMFEKLNSSYVQATGAIHAQHADFHARAQQTAAQHDTTRRQLLDPVVETENELNRIAALLAHPPVLSPDLPPQLLQQAQQQAMQMQGIQGRAPPRSPPRRQSLTSTIMGASLARSPPDAGGIFNQMDRNHDGVIDQREFRDAQRQNFQQVL